ncbi:hypothetical protein LHFGNBLO_006030 (plasmid) [Mesorhizobium sp. AR10]|uniref:hypothetical protein n=1 Tax=Mesorhizobium sp. AR10 TaxID=2865839 RepID=UPI00215EA6B2|nr:hypothetical protein [Mesorhizobium sp. AR10]UVK35816.1 hypothetical protein LHFGNBLO_006030 [Mesorhizobium sp. AR10]
MVDGENLGYVAAGLVAAALIVSEFADRKIATFAHKNAAMQNSVASPVSTPEQVKA